MDVTVKFEMGTAIWLCDHRTALGGFMSEFSGMWRREVLR